MFDKNAEDWIDVLAGQSVPDADPKTVREAQIFRGALLAHADRLEDDSEIPYPHILENVLSRLEKSPNSPFTKKGSFAIPQPIKQKAESPTPDIKISQVNLNQWLQDNFVEAIKTGWLALEEILVPVVPAVAFRGEPANCTRGKKIKRAKQIDLGDKHTVVLVIELEEQDEPEIRILMRLSAAKTQTYVPENLKFQVIPEIGEPLEEVAGTHHDYLEQDWFYDKGERFRVVVALNEISVTEDFVITSTAD